MSDAKAEAPKKKGKMPLILGLVLVLGGGGFFMTKGKKKEVPEAKLAPHASIVEMKEEFLVNMKGGETYLRCKIALHPEALAKKPEIEGAGAAISDAIYSRLRATTLESVQTDEGLHLLRRQLVSDINWVIESMSAHEAEEPKSKKKKKDEEDLETGPPTLKELPDPEELENPKWDSDEGPILKLYFTSFATQ